MRLRQAVTISTGIAGCLLMAQTGWAGATLDGWEVLREGERESVRITWDEPAVVEMTEFPAARQFVLRIPGAEAPDLNRLTSEGALQSARAQTITLSDGREALQLTFSMTDWAAPRMETSPRALTVSWDAPASRTAPAPVLNLSNEDISAVRETRSFGSASAPATGAGQANGDDVFSAFYVPPSLTAEQRTAGTGGVDQGMLNTMELFNRTVNMDYKDASLENVLRSIANRLNLNIIMMPGDVQGRVTVSLQNVRLGDAFDSMLKANDLGYKIEEGGIVRIVSRDLVSVTEREFSTQSIAVNWVDASDVVSVIEPFKTEDGQIQFHQQTNTVIIMDLPEKVAELQALIERIDVPEKQVRMEVRVVDMTEQASRDLGIRNQVIGQEGRTYNVLGDDGGVDLEDAEQIFLPDVAGTGGGAVAAGSGLDLTLRSTFGVLGNEYSLETQLTALETRNEAVILANPTIVSLNNVTSRIEIQRQIPYLDATNTTQGSVSQIEFAEVGTLVEITPRITNNGFVILDIQPEQKIQVGEAFGVPVIDERFAITSVIAKDEQTVVLGGLRQFESQNSRDGIPWILNVPVIGQFFRTSSDSLVRTELALFVTPHIVKDPEPSLYEMALYEKIDYNWELPDYWYDEVRTRKGPAETLDPRANMR